MTYTVDIINLFLLNVWNNIKTVEIAERLNITRQTVRRWKIIYSFNIDSRVPLNKIKKEHKDSKSKAYVERIVTFVQSNLGCSLEDIKKSINNELSPSTICKILKQNKITHKRISNSVVCDSLENIDNKRTEFMKNLNFDVEDAVYIDETSFCLNDLKNYGYSKSGESIKICHRHKQNKKRLTLISAISKNGIVANEIVDGSVNREIYLNFLQKNKSILENKVVVQDNARIHHAKVVKEYGVDNNIILKYNPPYSPEFNPIELAFNKMKIEFKKLSHDNLIKDIIFAYNTITTENCAAFFKKSYEFMQKYV